MTPKNRPPSSDSLENQIIEQSKPENLLEQTLQLSLLQLAIFKKKLSNNGELTDKENAALCTYMRTFAQLAKIQKESQKEKKKEIGEMTDEELRAEISKLTAGVPEEDL